MLYILLDIDGTILPAQTNDLNRKTVEIRLGLSEIEFPLCFYADIVQAFAALSRRSDCQIIMCTSWDESSLRIAELLNIEVLDYMTFFSENPEHWYKWDSIVQFCQSHPGDSVILCDDLASRENTPRPRPRNLIKIFQPDPRKGLTIRDLKKIEKLARRID